MSFQTLFCALFGWLVGVLINHAADVLPGHTDLGSEPACPYCNIPRAPAAWSAAVVPCFRKGVVGYLSGRRLCLGCGSPLFSQGGGAPLPIRAVIVELATPVIFVGLLWRYGLSVQLGLLCLYSVVLILVTVTDLEHRMIPHAVMAPALLIAVTGAFFNQEMTARRAMLGGVVGLAVLYGMYLLARPVSRWLGRLAHRPVDEAPFGFGDVTLGAFVGLITGLPGVFLALIITLLSAGLVAAAVLAARAAIQRRYVPFATIPYGPFLALGGFVMMVYGPELLRRYVGR